MASFTQSKRILSFTSPLGADKLLVESYRGIEAISDLYDFDIEVVALPSTSVTPTDLIGKRVTLQQEVTDTGTLRSFNGIVASLEYFGGDNDFNTYRIRMVPTLWLLSLNTNTRVFQGMTVVDIVKKVLTPYSITPTDDTSATYTQLDYCTQYRETDLQFIRRLMEQHGIFFYHTHTSTSHTMVLADNSAKQPPCATVSSFIYTPNPRDRKGFYDAIIESFGSKSTLVTGQHTFWDYRFTQFETSASNPAVSATKADLGANSHEFYDYADGPSAYLKTASSDGNIATLQSAFQNMERDLEDAQSVLSTGRSNAGVLEPGFTFTLSEYPQAVANTKYLLTRVEHEGSQRPSYRSEQAAKSEAPYRNVFNAQPASLPYRTAKVTPKPRVYGVVTGKVVAPSGDDSYLDKYGRVCVQFWWDRTRKPNTTDNTLLRVAQQWAGKGWGTYFWPRIGDEVLIDFLDGDPDAPIVVGSLYNGTNMPKYDPAGEYTRSGILTQSSKNGAKANANELRFEDLKGSEQIFINAEKDFDTHVENDHHFQVDNDQHLTVTGNRYESIGKEHHEKITGNSLQEIDGDHSFTVKGKELEAITGDKAEKIGGEHKVSVGGNQHINVSQALNEKVGMNYSLQVGMNHFNKAGMVYVVDSGEEVHIKGGLKVVIESGLELCLSGPGGFVSIGPTGVMIQGIMVMINSGGASVPGTPGSPESPQAPDAPTAPTAPTWPGDDPRA
jgi:type VI secretion system secreted protein VgrG